MPVWKAPRLRRAVWLGMAAMAALLLAFAMSPAASRVFDAGVTLAGWSVSHWGCPQPVEANPNVTCGFALGLPPTR
jgi:hypothetical protein